MATESWTTPGSYTWDVPSSVAEATVRVWGAAGGAPSSPALGGHAEATFSVSDTDTLYPYVGGAGSTPTGGFNGGGDGGADSFDDGDGGGGASDVRLNAETLSDRIIVAGGGGGYSGASADHPGGDGGGANSNGADGQAGNSLNIGHGGTQSAGGGGGDNGQDGSSGVGGNGGSGRGGGGGGGYYGGGGGGGLDGSDSTIGAGGGGSGWVDATGSSVTGSDGVQSGDGKVEIEYILAAPQNVSAVASGTTITVTWDDTYSNENGFEVYRDTSSGVDTSATPVASLSANTTQYDDTGLDEGETYYYRVVAIDSSGQQSLDSAEVSATTDLPGPTNVSSSLL